MLAHAPLGQEEPLAGVVERYQSAGFTRGFRVRPGGRLLCLSCRHESDARDVAMLGLQRIEGASDPDDEAAVVAVECPICDSEGVLALAYGPAASADEAMVLARLRDERDAPPNRPLA